MTADDLTPGTPRPARVGDAVTTETELDALPVGSVVREQRDGYLWGKRDGGGWSVRARAALAAAGAGTGTGGLIMDHAFRDYDADPDGTCAGCGDPREAHARAAGEAEVGAPEVARVLAQFQECVRWEKDGTTVTVPVADLRIATRALAAQPAGEVMGREALDQQAYRLLTGRDEPWGGCDQREAVERIAAALAAPGVTPSVDREALALIERTLAEHTGYPHGRLAANGQAWAEEFQLCSACDGRWPCEAVHLARAGQALAAAGARAEVHDARCERVEVMHRLSGPCDCEYRARHGAGGAADREALGLDQEAMTEHLRALHRGGWAPESIPGRNADAEFSRWLSQNGPGGPAVQWGVQYDGRPVRDVFPVPSERHARDLAADGGCRAMQRDVHQSAWREVEGGEQRG